ncbi:MAG: hypothetical protein C0602_09655 [Denitrovibrio sp.]|nr:MAG: hypothetical protein C0602_09655 [Denitrovibrio sp.]
MIWIISAIILACLGFIFLIFANSGSSAKRDNSKLTTFVNHPECIVRITDKTNYAALESENNLSKADYLEKVKSNLIIRIYDIRSTLYNIPEGKFPEYKHILGYSKDIYELFCMMAPHSPESAETAYVYKSTGNKGSDVDDAGISCYGFSPTSLAHFINLGILEPDNEKSKVSHYASEMDMQELLDMAQMNSITLIGEDKEALFRNAYKQGLLSKVQVGSKPPMAYRVAKNYFSMENAFFDMYCSDVAKNLEGVHKIYIDHIIDVACRVNMFNKTNPKNRLTERLQKLKLQEVSTPS